MKVIDLDYLENTPLSNQLRKFSGDSWNAHDWTDENGKEPGRLNPGEILKNKNTGQLFRLPKRQSKVIDYFGESWTQKMRFLQSREVIQIDLDTHEHLLCGVPPVRGGWSAFLVGEAMCHREGRAIYACCFEVDEKYFLTYLNITEFEDKEHVKRYEEHLKNYDLF